MARVAIFVAICRLLSPWDSRPIIDLTLSILVVELGAVNSLPPEFCAPLDNFIMPTPSVVSPRVVLALRSLMALFHLSDEISPMLHPKFCVHCCRISGYSRFKDPEVAINWQKEITSKTDGDIPLDGFAPLVALLAAANGTEVNAAAEVNMARILEMAVSAMAAAVKETEAIVMAGELALRVFVKGMEVHRPKLPCAS